MILKTSVYKLDEKSEFKLIENREAVNNLRNDFPEIRENIGLNKNLLQKEEKKLLK
jgi:hypothetical protein